MKLRFFALFVPIAAILALAGKPVEKTHVRLPASSVLVWPYGQVDYLGKYRAEA